jgi:hypothetical protein
MPTTQKSRIRRPASTKLKQHINAAQQAILGEFQTISEKYTEVLDSSSCLGNEFHTAKLVQDKCHLATQQQIGTMMQRLLSINNSLATSQKAEVLLN